MKLAILFVTSALLIGCASVSQQEASHANFGAMPANYQQRVKEFMATQLKDPYTAVYRFGTPRRGFDQDGFLMGGKKHYGWIVPTFINAKNSFGGYVGEELHYIFLGSDGTWADVTPVMGQMANFIK